MPFTYEVLCPNCGKPILPHQLRDQKERRFCNMACYRQYQAKKKAAAEAAKVGHIKSQAKTPEEQCKHCQFGCSIGGTWGCDYFEITGHCRIPLHPGGLPDECQEFDRKRRGRKPKSTKIL